MSVILPETILAVIAEIGRATNEIIHRHWDEDAKKPELEQTLKYWEGVQVRLYTEDGPLAFYYEDGVELLPKEEK